MNRLVSRRWMCTSLKPERLSDLKSRLSSGPKLGDFLQLERSSARRVDYSGAKDLPKPKWLSIPAPSPEAAANVARLSKDVAGLNVATVCQEAKCPNLSQCWGGGPDAVPTGTIMIMGDTCTRGCNFCAVATARNPAPLDPDEPRHVAEAVKSWGLSYVVLTSVDRDDLDDQGSYHFASTVQNLKQQVPGILVECLTPDFRADEECVRRVAVSGLDVFAHNIETVERLTPSVRDRRAGYAQSWRTLEMAAAAKPGLFTKTSIMLGLGEKPEEVRATMQDARNAGVQIITLGQYLRPTKRHLPVSEYVHPDQFAEYERDAQDMGFMYVASGPLVRSSYKAGELFLEGKLRQRDAANRA